MDWEKAANIATVVEAIVVTVSIIFIWKQLRQQTKLTRIANTQALVNISSPFNLELIKDPKMAALWVRGAKDYSTFDEAGQYQYKSLLIWWLIFQENIFYQQKEGLLDEKIYASWDYDLRLFVSQQNLSERWGELKNAFQAEFRDYIAGLINEDVPNNAMQPAVKWCCYDPRDSAVALIRSSARSSRSSAAGGSFQEH